MNNAKNITGIILSLLLVVGLPPAGLRYLGTPVAPYLIFPPRTGFVQHPGFSWFVFIGIAFLVIISIFPFLVMLFRHLRKTKRASARHFTFPRWGLVGAALLTISWLLSWINLEWAAPFRIYLYSPLWFGYIILINALTHWRSGTCMLIRRPRFFLFLFPLSSLYWWFFEFLNRFVQNWYYRGVAHLSATEYIVAATIAFSTVLPAVLGTADFLGTFPRFKNAFSKGIQLNPARPGLLAGGALLAASMSLFAIGIRPQELFPLVWVSPLVVVVSVQVLLGKETILSPLTRGNWERFALLAFASLFCGFLWELWNYYSPAKWIYTVPYVHRFLVFEMPILGYAGYLPFGLECGAVASWIAKEA